jgi:hypothetical protein
VHFDSAPIHTSKVVTDTLVEIDLKGMLHPSDNPDLPPCDLFPFGYPKGKLIDKKCVTPGESCLGEVTRISQTPSDMITRVVLLSAATFFVFATTVSVDSLKCFEVDVIRELK